MANTILSDGQIRAMAEITLISEVSNEFSDLTNKYCLEHGLDRDTMKHFESELITSLYNLHQADFERFLGW